MGKKTRTVVVTGCKCDIFCRCEDVLKCPCVDGCTCKPRTVTIAETVQPLDYDSKPFGAPGDR